MSAVENFRTNLRTAMKAKNLSQGEVASAAKMGLPYVNRVLQGHTKPGIEQCERLAKAVGFTLITLLEDTDNFSESVLTPLP